MLDRAHSVFQERIIGNPEKSQGRIITRALLLSDEAKIGNKPELQIFGIAVRAGTLCAMPLIERLGVSTTCRASLALYNTHADVDALARAVNAVDELLAYAGGDAQSDNGWLRGIAASIRQILLACGLCRRG